MHDVIVVDEEFEAAESCVSQACAQLEDVIAIYLNIMSEAATQGTISGSVAEALRAFVGSAREMQTMIQNVRQQHSAASKGFLSAIDAADQFLY